MSTIPVAAFRFYSESAAAVKDVRSMGAEVGKVDKNTTSLNVNFAKLGGFIGAVAIAGFEILANGVRALEAAFFGLAAATARQLQFWTFGDVSEAFAASVDANLAKANDALMRIKSIEEIQLATAGALERSRAAAEAAAAASGLGGTQTLGEVSYDVGGIDFGQITADLQAEFDLRQDFLAMQIEAETAAHMERLAEERQFIQRRGFMQQEAQDLFNRITQGGVMFEIELHELKNQTLLQSGASLVGLSSAATRNWLRRSRRSRLPRRSGPLRAES